MTEKNHTLISDIREALLLAASDKQRISIQRFFKEPITCYGVPNEQVYDIAKTGFAMLPNKDIDFIFNLCDTLWNSGMHEEGLIASTWIHKVKKQFQVAHLNRFENWIEHGVTNWALCDTFCSLCTGEIIMRYPHLVAVLYNWTTHPNRWKRRAAAVSLIMPARKGLFHAEGFQLANMLLTDPDDMIQKGYGWLLKTISKRNPDPVFEWILQHKHRMPRLALRYAIEHMPVDMRQVAMRKE